MKPNRIIRIGYVLIIGISLILFAGCKTDDDDDSSDSSDSSTSLTWTLAESDDFNRADNTFTTADKDIMLGSDWDTWADEDDDPNSMIQITSGQVEIRGDSGGDYQTALNAAIVKIYIEMTTADVASLDTTGGDYSNCFGISEYNSGQSETGCPYSGGVSLVNGVYNTYLVEGSGNDFETRASEEIQFLPDTTYQMELIIDDGDVTFSLKDDSGTAVSTLTYSGSSCTFQYPQFSFSYKEDVSFFYDNFKAYTGVYEEN